MDTNTELGLYFSIDKFANSIENEIAGEPCCAKSPTSYPFQFTSTINFHT